MNAPLWFAIGIATVPVVSLFVPDIRHYILGRIQARRVINDYLDPILKTADELYGKIFDLAKTDFKDVYKVDLSDPATDKIERIYILYLFASFFGRISVLRHHNYYSQISRVKQGRRLVQFLKSFESKSNIRFINRANQRLIGDTMMKFQGDKTMILTMSEFHQMMLNNENRLREKLSVIDNMLEQSYKREIRQRVLYFGIMIRAFIDFFDAKKLVTKKRLVVFTNKLSPKTKYQLKFKLFGTYLKFIKSPERYYYKNQSARAE